jgi:hypothetical protein
MAGGTKPRVGTKRAEKFKDGLKKSGGVNSQRHAGPGRQQDAADRGPGRSTAKANAAMSIPVLQARCSERQD